MAEQNPSAKSDKAGLIAALVLGVLVVVLYNVQINRIANSRRGKIVPVVVVKRSMDVGERIEPGDVELKKVDLEPEVAEGLGGVVDDESQVIGQTLNKRIFRNRFLRWTDIAGAGAVRPSSALRKNKEAFTVSIEPRVAPGMILSVGDRVALLGKFSLKGGGLKSYRIIQGVRVLAVGGVVGHSGGTLDRRSTLSRKGQRSYRSLTLEVSPETSTQLDNVLSFVQGPPRVVVLSPENDYEYIGEDAHVLDELQNLIDKNKIDRASVR
ncbi:MAG: hypothetical protein J7M14_01275 [Planctomycetes bacterium]|nr:hypothetical protein [Planctomycetota bacterium]